MAAFQHFSLRHKRYLRAEDYSSWQSSYLFCPWWLTSTAQEPQTPFVKDPDSIFKSDRIRLRIQNGTSVVQALAHSLSSRVLNQLVRNRTGRKYDRTINKDEESRCVNGLPGEGSRRTSENHTWETLLGNKAKLIQELVDERLAAMLPSETFSSLTSLKAKEVWASIQKLTIQKLETWANHQDTRFGATVTRPGTKFFPRFGYNASSMESGVLLELISRAMDEYFADVVAGPDYALYNSGGRIIPELTFTDYHYNQYAIMNRRSWLSNFVRRHIYPFPLSVRFAEKAIRPSMHPGDCWAMSGSIGQIGVRLTRRIIVTAVTIEHVDPRLALDRGSAPREIEVWRLIAPLTGFEPATGAQVGEKTGLSSIKGTWWKEGSPLQGASKMATFEYQSQSKYGRERQSNDNDTFADFFGGKEQRGTKLRQTFLIPRSKQNVASAGVVVKINSNWGHPRFTCLYRVQVHGYEPSIHDHV
ncbi:hypothetical protein BGX28_004041 [Mortierella sp. GBA30]|nr:hypothetical protein BGX28_004041 [Mortierella sp. GBA30]